MAAMVLQVGGAARDHKTGISVVLGYQRHRDRGVSIPGYGFYPFERVDIGGDDGAKSVAERVVEILHLASVPNQLCSHEVCDLTPEVDESGGHRQPHKGHSGPVPTR